MRVEIAKWAVKWYGTIPWDEMTDAQREVWLLEAAELLALLGEDREPVGEMTPLGIMWDGEIPVGAKLFLHPPTGGEVKGVVAYQTENGDLYIITNENMVGAVHHFYAAFPEHKEWYGELKPLTLTYATEGVEDV